MQQFPLGIFFSLLDGIALAGFYTFNKKISRSGSPLQIIFWICATHLPPLLIWAALSLPLRVSAGYFLPGMGVVLLTVLGNVLSIRALSLSPFGLMMPVMCLSPVFTSLIGIPLLHEWPAAHQWLGIVLAVLGVLWLYVPPEKPFSVFSFWPQFFRERGARSMVGSALCWSLSAPMDKVALQYAEPAFHATFVFSGLVLFLFIWLSLRKEWSTAPIARNYWGLLFLTGAAGAAADVLQLFAVLNAPVGTVEAIKRVASQVLGVGVSIFLFHEGMTLPKTIGMIIICIGVPMIVL